MIFQKLELKSAELFKNSKKKIYLACNTKLPFIIITIIIIIKPLLQNTVITIRVTILTIMSIRHPL